MSDPELNLEDDHLTRALEELAQLVDAPVQQYVSLKESRNKPDDSDSDNQIPQPLLEPIPIEVPLPPTPVMVQPSMNAVLTTTSENGAANERGLFAELAALSEGTAPVGAFKSQPEATRFSYSQRTQPFSAGIVALVILVTFLAGMLTERFVRLLEGRGRVDVVRQEQQPPPVVDNELTGRISYKTKDGESQPDRGARILIFPQQRSGEVKLPVVGFRPADSPADQLVANAALKAAGGAAATVDATGSYRVPIEAGSYRLLVLSHFQPRDAAVSDPGLDRLLSEYFDQPEELLGRVQYRFSPLRIKGTGDMWDYAF